MTRRLVFCVLTVLVATGGCSLLAPRPDPSRFYVLTATETAAVGTMPRDAALLLGPITVSTYLQRPQVATRVPPNRIEYSQLSRWAEPLEANVARVLAGNLAVLLATEEVYTYPAFPAGPLVLQIALRIERLERGPAGEAEIVAQWTIRDPKRGVDLDAKRRALTEAAGSADMDASVEALSRAFGRLSREVAASVVAVDLPTSAR
jgi:uncharacterized lipoprotein YmbA